MRAPLAIYSPFIVISSSSFDFVYHIILVAAVLLYGMFFFRASFVLVCVHLFQSAFTSSSFTVALHAVSTYGNVKSKKKTQIPRKTKLKFLTLLSWSSYGMWQVWIKIVRQKTIWRYINKYCFVSHFFTYGFDAYIGVWKEIALIMYL